MFSTCPLLFFLKPCVSLIVFWPLASTLISLTKNSRLLGQRLINFYLYLFTTSLTIALWLYLYYFKISKLKNFNFILGNWFQLKDTWIEFNFLFDYLSITMLIVIYVISTAVHFFALFYMKKDPKLNLFLALLSLFTFFMVFMVTSSNLLMFFIGWEGIGILSFLLIGFWSTRWDSALSAFKAVAYNRIGDFFFICVIFITYYIFGTTSFADLQILAFYAKDFNFSFFGFNITVINLISYLLALCAGVKSAQLGFHAWLPDAMEGPTPVSALLHAATMVTAGVYLLVRCSFFLSLSGEVNTFLVWWGTLTICYAGLVGFFQYDIKRIIAYSTCSQLGYMFVACGLLNPNLAFFHLFNHAFFKAALFLSAGLIIHLNQGEQDLRKMQTPVSLNYIEVFVIVANLLANFSLMGLPFFSGYYSKDLIMFCAGSNNVLTGLLIIGAIITVGYSLKLFYYLFNAKKIKLSSKLVSLDYVKDALFFEGLFPISFLLILSVLSGLTISYFMPYFIYVYSPGQSYVPGSIESYVTGISNQPKLAPLVFFLLLVVSVSFYLWLWKAISFSSLWLKIFSTVSQFFGSKGFFDILINNLIVENFKRFYLNMFFLVEKYLIETVLIENFINLCYIFFRSFRINYSRPFFILLRYNVVALLLLFCLTLFALFYIIYY